MALLEVRIFSARCFGVYVTGAASRKAADGPDVEEAAVSSSAAGTSAEEGAAATASAGAPSLAPHSPQNFCVGEFGWPHPGQAAGRRAPHSPQNFFFAGFSARQGGHRILGPPGGAGVTSPQRLSPSLTA